MGAEDCTRENFALQLGMPDVQNLFHEALAVMISKQYLYTRRKLSVSSIERYHFQLRVQCVRKLRPFTEIFPHTNFNQ